jgi:uncharacterized protein
MHVRMAGVAALMTLVLAPAAAAASTLSVDGAGRVQVAPDVATLSLSVVRSASTSRGALSSANHRVNVVTAALRGAGGTPAGIQTSSIDVSSAIVRVGPHRRRTKRFTATEQLTLTLTDVHLVGRVVDAAVRAGAENVNGPNFSFSDPSAGKAAAERAALADARRRADAAAAAIGYKVTGVDSVDLDPSSPVLPVSSGGGSAPSASAQPTTPTTVNPGTQEVDASVRVVYTIAPA